jgi:hypothetical protein
LALSANNFVLCTQLLTDKAWELFLDNSLYYNLTYGERFL